LGFGQQGFLGINLTVHAPDFSGTGVYLNPLGVVNAASFAPFSVGVSPGELITLFGTNLAASTQVDATFPTTLNNVQVMINNRLAPIYVVSATQLSVLVPWATSGGVASIKVINNGVSSNTVTVFNDTTTPGIFTVPPGGIGYAAALHQDGTLITAANPARIGETISVYLTGLGAVAPAIGDGAPGPVNPLSNASAPLAASVSSGDQSITATIVYSGLAPQLRIYQMNITIPSGVATGDQYLNVEGPDSYNSEVLLPIGRKAGAEPAEKPALEQASTLRRSRGRRVGKTPRSEPRVLLP